MNYTTKAVQENQLYQDQAQNYTDVVLTSLKDLGENNVTYEDAIAQLNLNKDIVDATIKTLDATEQDALKTIFEDAENARLLQQKQTLLDAGFTYDADNNLVPPTSLGSSRRLVSRSVTNPYLMKVPDETIQNIRQYIQDQRRLLQAPDDATSSPAANDFSVRLQNHIQDLQGHLRRLGSLSGCDSGATDLQCASDKIQDLADGIVDTGNKVVYKLNVFNPILEGIPSGEATMTDLDSLVGTVYTAVDVASKIPSIGSSFTPVKNFMTPIKNGIGGIKTQLSNFQNSVGSLWSNSIGHLETIIDSFDTGDMSVAISVADAFASMQTSTCIPSFLETLTGVDIFDGTETALVTIVQYVDTFLKALKQLLQALRTDAYITMRGALKTIVDFLEDVDTAFTPFNPLGDLLTTEVEIPWVSLPYAVKDKG